MSFGCDQHSSPYDVPCPPAHFVRFTTHIRRLWTKAVDKDKTVTRLAAGASRLALNEST